MRSRVPLLVCLLLVGSFASPLAAHAGSIPFFGPIIENSWFVTGTNGTQVQCALGWGAVLIVINNIIRFAITLAIVFIAPLMIAYAGFLYVVNPAKPGDMVKAKGILLHVISGIVVALASWMIVDAIMAVLYNQNTFHETWYSLITSGNVPACLTQAGIASGLNQATNVGGGTGINTGSGTSGGGACTPATAGPCTVANLTATCFSTNATAANKVCGTESTGDPSKLSSGDKLHDGRSYSVGLFQINLTNSYSLQVDGQSCANAFTAACQNSVNNNVGPNGACSASVKHGLCGSITCVQLYNDCVTSAQTASNNINQACALSGNGTNWGRWSNTASACGL